MYFKYAFQPCIYSGSLNGSSKWSFPEVKAECHLCRVAGNTA